MFLNVWKMRSDRLTIVVTGGIGSGKTELCRFLERQGIPVYYCDERTKALYEGELLGRLERELETELSDGRGRADFAKIAACVFNDPQKLRRLEDIVYPAVRDDFLRWRSDKRGLLVMESAVFPMKPLFADLADKVIEVRASDTVRVDRVMRRSSVSRDEVVARISCQEFPESFSPDYRIENEGSLEEMYKKTEIVLEQIKNENRFI